MTCARCGHDKKSHVPDCTKLVDGKTGRYCKCAGFVEANK